MKVNNGKHVFIGLSAVIILAASSALAFAGEVSVGRGTLSDQGGRLQ